MHKNLIRSSDRDLLLRLLRTPTIGPLEATTDCPAPRLWQAQREYAESAADLGFRTVHHACADPSSATRPDVPVAVREAQENPEFLRQQPNLVLCLGSRLATESTIMFNVHLDTVAGWEPVDFTGTRFYGRGAVDAKGPAVALLSGIRAAVAADPGIGRDTTVLVQAVSGEEGGAMGTYGTRPLVEAGFLGRLNIFCEPTGSRYLTRSTAAMTACVEVTGQGSIDDQPGSGHNASVLLGFLAQHFARTLDGTEPDGRVCVAGLHTGELHNRVYGTGRLLLNLSYSSSEAGARIEEAVTREFGNGLRAFRESFAGTREFARTALEAPNVTALSWHKRGLPCLNESGSLASELLGVEAGIARWPDDEPAFTCDAIWMEGIPETSTVVYGPGSLEHNNAHSCGEFVDCSELQHFATGIAHTLTAFARRQRLVKRKETA